MPDAYAAAPCSGQRNPDGSCWTCGHPTAEHDEQLVCRPCRIDELAEWEADQLRWWRSEQ